MKNGSQNISTKMSQFVSKKTARPTNLNQEQSNRKTKLKEVWGKT